MPTLTDIGRIGRDAELRSTSGPNPTPVVALTLACDYGRKGQDGKKPTQWVEAVIFGRQAEALAPYLLKGQLMHFTIDDVHIEEFKRTDGTPGNKLTGKVIAIKFAGSPPQQNQSAPQQSRPAPQQSQPQQNQQGTNGPDSYDDDIPFIPVPYLCGA